MSSLAADLAADDRRELDDAGSDLSAQVHHWAVRHGNRAFLEDARCDRGLSLMDLSDLAGWWDATLDQVGVERDAIVGLAVQDPMQLGALLLATWLGGRWAAPIDPAAAPETSDAALERIGVDVLVSDDRARRGALAGHPACGGRRSEGPRPAAVGRTRRDRHAVELAHRPRGQALGRDRSPWRRLSCDVAPLR